MDPICYARSRGRAGGLALLLGFSSRLAICSVAASAVLENRDQYALIVLDRHRSIALQTAKLPQLSPASGIVGTILAIAIACFELFGGYLLAPLWRLLDPFSRLMRQLHSGQIGDYVTWVVVGVSIFGAALMANFLCSCEAVKESA
jgi:hypothetical protein